MENRLQAHYTEEGNIWKRKGQEDLLSNVLYLGINDSIDNYEQVKAETIIDEENI